MKLMSLTLIGSMKRENIHIAAGLLQLKPANVVQVRIEVLLPEILTGNWSLVVSVH